MKISATIFLMILVLGCTTALSQASRPVPIKSFEFLGCSGDWNGKLGAPEIWRITGENGINFLTHHVADCGLSGRNPKASLTGSSLNLSYELISPSETVVMCDCEY